MSHAHPSVVHIASGDRWAGAEVQVCTLLTQLHRDGQVDAAAILLNDGELARRLRQQGVHVDILDESRLGFPALLIGVWKILSARRPDIVHTHRQKENLLGILAASTLGIPSVRTVHGAPEIVPSGLAKSLLAWIDGWTAEHVQKRVVAVSADLASQLRRRLPSATIVTIPNGIDADAVRAAATPAANLGPQAAGERQVGIVGRLDRVKRIDIFLDMAAELQRREPGRWRFHVFGEGQLRQELGAQAARLGIASTVSFHGHRLDIAACLAALDVLVMCSDHEGLPMTPLEALAVGTPVVAHAVGGLVEVLTDEPLGVLVDDHRANEYADAVERIVAPGAMPPKPEGPERDSRFSAVANAKAVSAMYVDLLAGRGR